MDPVLSPLHNGHTLQAVLATGATCNDPVDTQTDRELSQLVFPAANHPFYNIRWMFGLEHRDIIALRNTSEEQDFLSDRVILFYLTYVAALTRCERNTSVAVVSPQFTAFDSSAGVHSARQTLTGSCLNFRYMLIPIRRNAVWSLAIYDADPGRRPIVTYFDPLQRPISIDIREVIERALSTAVLDGALRANIAEADPLTFNRQIDGFNCGMHICLLAEHYLLQHRQTFLPRLDINAFRRKMYAVCAFLRGLALLCRVPVDHHRCASQQPESLETDVAITVDWTGRLLSIRAFK